MTRSDITQWFALKMVEGIGPVSFRALVEKMGSPREVFAAPQERLCSIANITEKAASSVFALGTRRKRRPLFY